MTKKSLWMNHLENRLHQWAEWYSRDAHHALGYPTCSLDYRLRMEGHITRSHFGSKPLPTHEAAKEIESWVCEMSQQNQAMAQALRCHYFEPGNLRIKAQRLKISHSHFKWNVDMAHQWLLGRFSAAQKYPSPL